jgi:hypothetical protein
MAMVLDAGDRATPMPTGGRGELAFCTIDFYADADRCQLISVNWSP